MRHPPWEQRCHRSADLPLACRAAFAVLDKFERGETTAVSGGLAENIRMRFGRVQKGFAIVSNVRGLGPTVGMDLMVARQSKEPALTKHLIIRCSSPGGPWGKPGSSHRSMRDGWYGGRPFRADVGLNLVSAFGRDCRRNLGGPPRRNRTRRCSCGECPRRPNPLVDSGRGPPWWLSYHDAANKNEP